jgi:outer membrane PBP1 activator LpoA protein
MVRRTFFLLSLCIFILAFIASCAPSNQIKKAEAAKSSASSQTIYMPNRSDAKKATRLYRQASRSFDLKLRQHLLLASAKAFHHAGKNDRYLSILNEIDPKQLEDSDYVDFVLSRAEIAAKNENWLSAEAMLEEKRFKAIDSNNKVSNSLRILELQIALGIKLGNVNGYLQKTISLAKSLPVSTDQQIFHDQIWGLLNRMPFNALNKEMAEDDTLAGWQKLAVLAREALGDRESQLAKFAQWKKNWSDHPAALTPPSMLRTDVFSENPPRSIAILLPFSDEYLEVSQTLLNGFMTAYYELLNQTGDGPDLQIYDTSARRLQDIYSEAVSNGAQMIIGPLRSAGVRTLIGLEELPVPTISLNRIKTKNLSGPENLFQFGLSPLDEMEQIAYRALNRNMERALLIVPDTGWGLRASEHFESLWSNHGGEVVSAIRYPENISDFSPILKPPLHIDLSEARGTQLRRFINSKLITRQRRRQDVDLVVMIGYPEVARRIKPTLDFLYAGDIPIYASSHVYGGLFQENLDRDLARVEFCAMPWTMEGQLPIELQPNVDLHPALRNFYALGYDTFLAYRQLLGLRLASIQTPIFGATGILTLSNGHIKRRTGWAKFDSSGVSTISPE